ncbi:hypothetical protein L6R52_00330 [Myxococcota bacterium]|nr:hypothetical protein [Myxococcota bacterium]
MARKHSGGSGRNKAFRKPTYRVTCSKCGTVEASIVRPVPGIVLTCMACDIKRRQAEKTAASGG